MKNTQLLFIFACLMIFSFEIKSQSKAGSSQGFVAVLEPKTNNQENFSFPQIDNYNGTYQFIVKQKQNFLLTTETFQIIEQNRKETENNTISLNEFLDVMIISKKNLKESGFVPYKLTYILK